MLRETEGCIQKLMDVLERRVDKGSYTPDNLNYGKQCVTLH